MPGLAPGHLYRLGVGKQTAEGTAQTTSEYDIGAYGIGLRPVETRERHEATDTLAYRRGGFKAEAHAEGRIEIPSFPDAAPRIINALFGTDTLTGAADPWTHTITRSDTRPWLTFWQGRPQVGGTTLWDRFEDCRVKTAEFGFTAGRPLRISSDIVGKKAVGNVAAPTITNTKRLDSAGPYHSMLGANLKLDLDATPAATQVRNILSGSIKFGYDSLELVQTDELQPRFEDPGLWTLGFSVEVLLQDYEAYLATFFGSKTASAASQSAVILLGAADFLFNVGPAANNNRTFQIQLPALEISMTPPEPDISGKGARATWTAELQHPASGEHSTLIYKNAFSSAY